MSEVSAASPDAAADVASVRSRARLSERSGWLDLLRTLGPYLALAAGWSVLLTGLRWNVNPDGVVYAVLTDRFAAGDLAGAVTTYWSPLLPAVAAPLTALGVPALYAIRLVLLVAGLVALALVRDLSLQAGAGRGAADLATWLAVPLVGAASLFGVYPELLLGALLLAHCRWVLLSAGVGGAALAGLFGGLAFLAKAVGLPFVLGFVAVVLIARLVRPAMARGVAVRSALVTVAVALLVSGPWIGVVSTQMGHVGLSSAGEFNARFAAPGSWGNPMSYPGLYPPADDRLTQWEDPPALPDLRNAPGAAGEIEGAATELAPVTVTDRVVNSVAQARVGVGGLVRRWWAVLPFAAVGLVVALRSVARRSRGGRVVRLRADGGGRAPGGPGVAVGLLVGAVAFFAGMSLLVVIERYLWFPMLATLPAAALGLGAVLRGRRPWVLVASGAALLAVVTLSLSPLVTPRWNLEREPWRLAEALEASAPLTGPVAGAAQGDWQSTQLVAYLSDVAYVGISGTDESEDAVAEELRDAGAAHLLVWGEAPDGLPSASKERPDVYDVTPDGLVPHTR